MPERFGLRYDLRSRQKVRGEVQRYIIHDVAHASFFPQLEVYSVRNIEAGNYQHVHCVSEEERGDIKRSNFGSEEPCNGGVKVVPM